MNFDEFKNVEKMMDRIKINSSSFTIYPVEAVSLIKMIYDIRLSLSGMSINQYQKAALRTESVSDKYPRILQGIMGLVGEAGECDDLLKKHLFQGHELDTEHLAKELGDVAWYLAICADTIGYDLETIFKMNVDKLMARYPEGFDSELSVHRNTDDV